jgi:hypothetical protein
MNERNEASNAARSARRLGMLLVATYGLYLAGATCC